MSLMRRTAQAEAEAEAEAEGEEEGTLCLSDRNERQPRSMVKGDYSHQSGLTLDQVRPRGMLPPLVYTNI